MWVSVLVALYVYMRVSPKGQWEPLDQDENTRVSAESGLVPYHHSGQGRPWQAGAYSTTVYDPQDSKLLKIMLVMHQVRQPVRKNEI